MPAEKRFSRREMLSLSAGTLLTMGLWPGALAAEEEPAESGEFHFVALNDLHYYSAKCQKWFERVLESIKSSEEKPDFLLVIGDAAENGTREQLGAIRDLFRAWKGPVHYVLGNHDYPTPTDRTAYDQFFPNQIN